ncbi:lysophospholipid acyltransferase family protein [Psychrobacter sp.]|uniref:lysophospholipid acyltransferase family protein n=1 Tax=Psychrobacter sp. TaxID=56811 RepID=UPI0026499EF0|nr:lysophospholipid acyltransferase family protein [Psychrobacter sp.]MDN6276250.1 1-acyl-sn-glycerol-3-phosphate acyltransferase [Psychrobacter sp.]MDN6307815.1 1-acyl-sn-glycerol-3-phosphate acyltransferase [Psychrobacter sp.]
MRQDKSRFSLRKQLGRGKQIAGMTTTIAGGLRTAQRIGAFKQPPRETLPRYIQTFCRKMVGSFGVKVVEVEPVEQHHGLWVSNHVSWMDIPVVGTVSPAFFLSKAEIGEWPVFGQLAHAAGTLFIERGSGDAGSVSTQIADFLTKGFSVIFFPEATTTDGKKIKRIHGALLQAAIDADVPVRPMLIAYVDKDGTLSESLPYYGKLTMKQSLKKVLDSKDVTAYVLPLEPIDPQGRSKSELTNLLQNKMQEGLAELHSRVLTIAPTA